MPQLSCSGTTTSNSAKMSLVFGLPLNPRRDFSNLDKDFKNVF